MPPQEAFSFLQISAPTSCLAGGTLCGARLVASMLLLELLQLRHSLSLLGSTGANTDLNWTTCLIREASSESLKGLQTKVSDGHQDWPVLDQRSCTLGTFHSPTYSVTSILASVSPIK